MQRPAALKLRSVLIATIAAFVAVGEREPGSAATAESERAVVLTCGNRILLLNASSGKVVLRRILAEDTGCPVTSGPRLVLSPDRRSLYVLVASQPASVAVLDAGTLGFVRRLRLAPGIRYRALALAADGTLYAAGNRPRRVGADSVLTRLQPAGTETITIRGGDPHDWFVYSAALSADDGRLIVSYHGGCGTGPVRCTTGADIVDLPALAPCTGQPHGGSGCVSDVHGAVEPYRDGWIAARGEAPVGILDREGRTLRKLDTRLRTHLMDFAVVDDTLYALGDCFKGTGVRAVSLATGSSRASAPPSVCGSGIAVGERTLAVIRRKVNVAGASYRPRGIVLVDRGTPPLARTVGTSSKPLDVLVHDIQ